MSLITINLHGATNPETDERLKQIMASQVQLETTLTAANTQLIKISGEVQGLIANVDRLKEEIANAGNTTPGVDAALATLQSSLDSIDAMVPDADTPLPEPEPEQPVNPEPGTEERRSNL